MATYELKPTAPHPIVIIDRPEGVIIRLEDAHQQTGLEEALSWEEWDALVSWIDWRRRAVKMEAQKQR